MPSVIRGSDSFDSKDVNVGTAKAFVNFKGTGTVTIRESFNVTSVTDDGTGSYIVNFTVPFAGVNYTVTISGGGTTAYVGAVKTDAGTYTRTASSIPLASFNTTNTSVDVESINLAAYGAQ